MSAIILRRRKLGRGSCNGIANVSTTGIKVVRNWVPEDWQSAGVAADDDGDIVVFRWGCTSSLTYALSEAAIVNTAKAIHWCSDKRQSRLDMQAAGVPVPQTFSYDPDAFEGNEFLEATPEERTIKWVARPARHAQGRNLFVGNFYQCQGWLDQFGNGYVSRLINKVAEYRVMVVQNRIAWVAKKTPGNPEHVAWNVAQGGRFDNVRWGEWPMRAVLAALAAAKVGELDFGGVDVMVDADGNPYVLEVNSAPSQTSPYRQQCLAKAFDYIVNNGKQHFPDFRIGDNVSWKRAIHPAVWSISRGR